MRSHRAGFKPTTIPSVKPCAEIIKVLEVNFAAFQLGFVSFQCGNRMQMINIAWTLFSPLFCPSHDTNLNPNQVDRYKQG